MNRISQIHQFTPSITLGDGVSQSLFYTQKILVELGFQSIIYANQIDSRLVGMVKHIDNYAEDENNVLIYHHSIGHAHHELIMAFKDQKILVYHNITPSHFFLYSKQLKDACDNGRSQLIDSSDFFLAAYADSDYNAKELIAYGYSNVETIPLLKNFSNNENIKFNEDILKTNSDTYNILHVGRIVSNKSQHEIINVIYGLVERGINDIKLFIVGGESEPEYANYLKNLVSNLSMSSYVKFCGKVSDEDLLAYYKNADLFITLSNHEGFCMPLIEAMVLDIPVLAYGIGGIMTTIPQSSTLNFKSPVFVANEILKIKNSPFLRHQMIINQREHLKQFSKHMTVKKLANFLNKYLNLNLSIPCEQVSEIDKKFLIEGPFDSSYSLSIVNQNLALELSKHNIVNLYSTEGYGDFDPNTDYLKSHSGLEKLICKYPDNIDITIRNLYPPRTNAMRGFHKIIGPYGWEESKFPEKYVNLFNSRLSIVACVSNYVKNVLQSNGVRIPMVVTGLGIEHILDVESKNFGFALPAGKKLLHISSCFPRKGADILVSTFSQLTNSYKDLTLIVKTFPNPHNQVKKLIADNEFKLTKVFTEDIELYDNLSGKILLINKDIDQSQINYLYETCDILVAPSRGEGFGLPQAEAMLFCMPVVTTNYSGQTDFCTEETSWLIDFKFDYAKTHINLQGSFWVEPDCDSLIQNLRFLLETPKEMYINKLYAAKKNIQNNFTWKNVVTKLENSIAEYPFSQKSTRAIGVVSTFDSKCGIAEYTKYLISEFDKNKLIIFSNSNSETISDSKNTIKCWKAGDDSNEDLVDLITLVKNFEIGYLIIQYNFSFFSLDNLAKLIDFCFLNNIETYLFIHSTKDVVVDGALLKSFGFIVSSLQKATGVMVHSINDMNIMKNFGVFRNTYLFDHGFDTTLLDVKMKPKVFDNLTKDTKIIATFGFLLPHKGIIELVQAAEILLSNNFDIRLILMSSIHPAPVSQVEKSKLFNYLENSKLKNRVYVNNDYISEAEVLSTLKQADAIVFPYQNTQESSSAAARFGLLAIKPVIVTPLEIFDDIKTVSYRTKGTSPSDIADGIMDVWNKNFDTDKQCKWIKDKSWISISRRFFSFMYKI